MVGRCTPVKSIRSLVALVLWSAIWLPTTGFVLIVLLRSLLTRGRSRSQAALSPPNGVLV